MAHQVTIIGSGIAALSAALSAEKSGSKVRLIRGRPGASALFSGAWDVAGFQGRHGNFPWSEEPTPRANLLDLARRNADHPYARVATKKDIVQVVEKGFESINQELGLRLKGSLNQGLVLVNPFGTTKTTTFTSLNKFEGNLLDINEGVVLVVGFEGMPAFKAAMMSQMLSHVVSKKHKQASAIKVISISLKLHSLPIFASPVEMAQAFDQEKVQEELHQAMQQQIQKHSPKLILLAPVVGIKDTAAILSRIRETTNVKVAETLSLVPSIPGVRLQQSIARFLEQKKSQWEIITGDVESADIQGKKVVGLKGSSFGKVSVDRLIVATGKYVSRGIEKEEIFQEPILNLPLFAFGASQKQRVQKTFIGNLNARSFLDEQKFMGVGVWMNENGQALNEASELAYDNVWVAGSLIGGTQSTREHSGMGIAVSTGVHAGEEASR